MPLLEMGNVTVVLEFQSIDHQGSNNTLLVASTVSYNVSACSEAQVDNQERRRAQLTLPYNVLCDVIVEASLCGHNSYTTNIQLRYSKCQFLSLVMFFSCSAFSHFCLQLLQPIVNIH